MSKEEESTRRCEECRELRGVVVLVEVQVLATYVRMEDEAARLCMSRLYSVG